MPEIIKEYVRSHSSLMGTLVSKISLEEYNEIPVFTFRSESYFTLKGLANVFTHPDWEYPVWQVGNNLFKAKLESELEP